MQQFYISANFTKHTFQSSHSISQ